MFSLLFNIWPLRFVSFSSSSDRCHGIHLQKIFLRFLIFYYFSRKLFQVWDRSWIPRSLSYRINEVKLKDGQIRTQNKIYGIRDHEFKPRLDFLQLLWCCSFVFLSFAHTFLYWQIVWLFVVKSLFIFCIFLFVSPFCSARVSFFFRSLSSIFLLFC